MLYNDAMLRGADEGEEVAEPENDAELGVFPARDRSDEANDT